MTDTLLEALRANAAMRRRLSTVLWHRGRVAHAQRDRFDRRVAKIRAMIEDHSTLLAALCESLDAAPPEVRS